MSDVKYNCCYMSDVKYNCCTARQMGEKLSDFSNVVIVKGLLVK